MVSADKVNKEPVAVSIEAGLDLRVPALAIIGLEEYGLPSIASQDDMVEAARDVQSRLSRHPVRPPGDKRAAGLALIQGPAKAEIRRGIVKYRTPAPWLGTNQHGLQAALSQWRPASETNRLRVVLPSQQASGLRVAAARRSLDPALVGRSSQQKL